MLLFCWLMQHFKRTWHYFDKHGDNYMPFKCLLPFLIELGPPMGLQKGAPRLEFENFVKDMDLWVWDKKVHFREVLLGVHRLAWADRQGVPPLVQNRLFTAPRFVHRMIQKRIKARLRRTNVISRLSSSKPRGTFASPHWQCKSTPMRSVWLFW